MGHNRMHISERHVYTRIVLLLFSVVLWSVVCHQTSFVLPFAALISPPVRHRLLKHTHNLTDYTYHIPLDLSQYPNVCRTYEGFYNFRALFHG